MFCPKCGAQNEDGARFCRACGAPMVSGAATPQAPQATQPQVTAAVPSLDARTLRIIGIVCSILLVACAFAFPVVKTNGGAARRCADALESVEKSDYDARSESRAVGLNLSTGNDFGYLGNSLDTRRLNYGGQKTSYGDELGSVSRMVTVVIAVGVVLGIACLLLCVRAKGGRVRLAAFGLFVIYAIVGMVLAARINGQVSSAVTGTISAMASDGASTASLATYATTRWATSMPGAAIAIVLAVVGGGSALMAERSE